MAVSGSSSGPASCRGRALSVNLPDSVPDVSAISHMIHSLLQYCRASAQLVIFDFLVALSIPRLSRLSLGQEQVDDAAANLAPLEVGEGVA